MRQTLNISMRKQWQPQSSKKGSAGEWQSVKLRLTLRARLIITSGSIWKTRIVEYDAIWFLKLGNKLPQRLLRTSGPMGRITRCSTQYRTNSNQLTSQRCGQAIAPKGPSSQAVQAVCNLLMGREELSSAASRMSMSTSAIWQGLRMNSPRLVATLKYSVRRKLINPTQKHIFSSRLGLRGVFFSLWSAKASLQYQARKMERSPKKMETVQWQSGGISLQQSFPPNCLMPDFAIPDAKYSQSTPIQTNNINKNNGNCRKKQFMDTSDNLTA